MGNAHTNSNSLAHCYELSFSSINEECKNQSEEEVSEIIRANTWLNKIIVDDSVSENIWDAVVSNPRIETVEFQKMDVEAEAVEKVFRDIKSVKNIRFGDYDLGNVLKIDDKRVFFLDHVQMNDTLESIDLCNVSFGTTVVKALVQSASLQASVINLDFYDSNVTTNGFHALVDSLPLFTALQELHFQDEDLVITNAIANEFAQATRNMRGSTVKVQLQVPVSGAYEMLAALVSNISLSDVSLDCTRPGTRFRSSIVTFESNDWGLSLYGSIQDGAASPINEISMEIAAQIARGTREPRCLTLSHCRLGPHEIQSLCDALVVSGAFVESLDLHYNRVGEQGLLSLGVMLSRNPALMQLVLSHNEISDDMICAFCDSLVPVETLKEMDLSHNDISDRGAAALAECIENEKLSPKSLTLSSNEIGDDGAVALAKCLAKDELMLRTLDLSYNRFGAIGTKAIANALARPTSPLEVLELRGIEDFGDDAYESLGSALKVNTKLKELWIGYSPAIVTERGVRAFLDGVKVHPTLVDVQVARPAFATLHADELHYYLELNKGARGLLQVQPPLPPALWPHVLKKADDCRNVDDGERRRAPDVLYYFVREKCDLFARSIGGEQWTRISA